MSVSLPKVETGVCGASVQFGRLRERDPAGSCGWSADNLTPTSMCPLLVLSIVSAFQASTLADSQLCYLRTT